MYSLPQAIISRDTFLQSGNFSNKSPHLDLLPSIYLVLWTHCEGYKSWNCTLKCQHTWGVSLRCRMTPKGKVNHFFGLLSLQIYFINVFVKIIAPLPPRKSCVKHILPSCGLEGKFSPYIFVLLKLRSLKSESSPVPQPRLLAICISINP